MYPRSTRKHSVQPINIIALLLLDLYPTFSLRFDLWIHVYSGIAYTNKYRGSCISWSLVKH